MLEIVEREEMGRRGCAQAYARPVGLAGCAGRWSAWVGVAG